MHNIYDVVDASVNHSSHNKSKTLRVKLTVTPEPRSHRRDTGTGDDSRSHGSHTEGAPEKSQGILENH